MSRHQPKMLVYLTGTCFILFLRLATVSRAAPPEYESSYPELMTQALEKVKRGQVAEGETLMREAVQLAEGTGIWPKYIGMPGNSHAIGVRSGVCHSSWPGLKSQRTR